MVDPKYNSLYHAVVIQNNPGKSNKSPIFSHIGQEAVHPELVGDNHARVEVDYQHFCTALVKLALREIAPDAFT